MIVGDVANAWQQALTTIRGWKNTVIVEEDDGYLHCECSTAFWGFTDDVELHLRPDGSESGGIIAIRSASRLGYGDLGTNRRRVESIRTKLIEAGVVAPSTSASQVSATKSSFANPMHTANDGNAIDEGG